MGQSFKTERAIETLYAKLFVGSDEWCKHLKPKTFFQTQRTASYTEGRRVRVSTQASCLRAIRDMKTEIRA